MDSRSVALDGEAARLALRQAARQQWWRLLLAMWVAMGGVAGDPGVLMASAAAAPWSWIRRSPVIYTCPRRHRSRSSLSTGRIGAPRPGVREQTLAHSGNTLVCLVCRGPVISQGGMVQFRFGGLGSILLGGAHPVFMSGFGLVAFLLSSRFFYILWFACKGLSPPPCTGSAVCALYIKWGENPFQEKIAYDHISYEQRAGHFLTSKI